MKDRLFAILGVESGEETMVSVLLTQSIFLGIFFGAFDISAHSLFLSVFDEKMMAKAYVLSGFAGILLTSIYTGLQNRMVFRNFAILNLFSVTVLTLILWVLILLVPEKWVYFLVFIMLGPLNILAMLGFWGTAGRLFTLRQGKRLFSLVDSGMIIGVILSCYAIPVLLSLNFPSHDILLISAVAVFTGSIVQVYIGNHFSSGTRRNDQENTTREHQRSILVLFREDPYIRIMAIFIALSVMTAFFVQYSFMAVTREQYPSEEDMARFLGLFTGSMMIFTLIVKLMVFSYLIRNYGLRTCLAISAVLVALFTIVALLTGSIMGYTPETSGFMLFFMLLALSRLFSKSLKDSIESPSFKVIYQTIDEKIRYGIQSGMDGTVNEISALTSGILLSGLGILTFIRLIHFSGVLLLITLAWIFFAFKLYSEYRKSIRKALESKTRKKPDETTAGDMLRFKSRFAREIEFRRGYLKILCGIPESFESISDPSFLEELLKSGDKKKDISLLPFLKKISADRKTDNLIRQYAAKITESLEIIVSEEESRSDKILSAKISLADDRKPQTTEVLRLMRDNSPEAKRLALLMIGKFRMADMIPEVCDALDIPGLELLAAGILRNFGAEAAEEMKRHYMINSGNTKVCKTILRILGDDTSPATQGFLYSRLWSNDREIREEALSNLVRGNFKVREEEKDRLLQFISDQIGIMVWNLSARISITRNNVDMLRKAVNSEISRLNIFLFNALAITYDAGSISKIRENLETGTIEGVNFALEMIDIVIDDSLKPKLTPLLDIISDEEKVKNLYQFYPGNIPGYPALAEDILNRDYNFLGVWIRACAIRSIVNIEDKDLKESLVALLFSPEAILREEAAMLFSHSVSDIFASVSGRLPENIREHLRKIFANETDNMELLFEKVKFLSARLNKIDEEHLLYLAEHMKYVKSADTVSLSVYGGFILWSVRHGEDIPDIEMVFQPDSIDLLKLSEQNYHYHYILPFKDLEKFHYLHPGISFEILEYLELNEKHS